VCRCDAHATSGLVRHFEWEEVVFSMSPAVVAPMGVILVVTAAPAFAAEFVPVASQRSLTNSAQVALTNGPVFSDFDAIGADDFEPFDETLTVTAQTKVNGEPASATAISSQQSTIESHAIAAAGTATMQLVSPAVVQTSGESISFFSVAFDVEGDKPVDVALSGFVTAEPVDIGGHAQVVFHLLPQGRASIVSAAANENSPVIDLDEAITLEPGRYVISIFANVALLNDESAGTPSTLDAATAEYDITLNIVPVLGDLDGDGTVGPADLAALLASWGACPGKGECAADIAPPRKGDGLVGAADLAALLANWE
jgi:hypothetical protein